MPKAEAERGGLCDADMGVSLKTRRVAGRRSLLTAANAWCRSANASNSNNFCLVNTDGSANNNNANNSWALAPDFA